MGPTIMGGFQSDKGIIWIVGASNLINLNVTWRSVYFGRDHEISFTKSDLKCIVLMSILESFLRPDILRAKMFECFWSGMAWLCGGRRKAGSWAWAIIPLPHRGSRGRKEAGTLGNRKPRPAAEKNPQEEALRQEWKDYISQMFAIMIIYRISWEKEYI